MFLIVVTADVVTILVLVLADITRNGSNGMDTLLINKGIACQFHANTEHDNGNAIGIAAINVLLSCLSRLQWRTSLVLMGREQRIKRQTSAGVCSHSRRLL
jgi:hypothetical protein